jgi:hypothetical protein
MEVHVCAGRGDLPQETAIHPIFTTLVSGSIHVAGRVEQYGALRLKAIDPTTAVREGHRISEVVKVLVHTRCRDLIDQPGAVG